MPWTCKQIHHGDGIKTAQVRNEHGELILDLTVDADTVFTAPVCWQEVR